MLPNFLVIGAPKAGTTSLYHYLRAHPEVFMSGTKELDFFIARKNWSRGLGWYEAQFADANGAQAVGEASPRYAVYPAYPDVPERISGLLPNARLVYVLRHPVERLISLYQHRFRGNTERRPFEKAVREDCIYLDGSRYALQIEQYLEHFPREQLLLVLSEQLRSERDRTLETVFRFVGVDPEWRSPAVVAEHNVTAEKVAPRGPTRTLMELGGWNRVAGALPERVKELGRRVSHAPLLPVTVSPQLRGELEEELREDVRRLRSYLGDGFDGWGLA
jgi:hypothetical protein